MLSTKQDVASYAKPDVTNVYDYQIEIDVTPKGASRTWAKLCAGFNNISEALNEQIQQYFFLCGKGHAANYVTGMAPAVTITGVRVVGDTAQDFIFSKKYELMTARDTRMKLTRFDTDGTPEIISANVTFANITDMGGATTDGSAVSIELRFNGEPYLGNAWDESTTSYIVTQNLTGCTSSFTGATIQGGSALSATLTADTGYTLADSGITVTMGGVDITAEVVSSGVIAVAAVTGDIVITAIATED